MKLLSSALPVPVQVSMKKKTSQTLSITTTTTSFHMLTRALIFRHHSGMHNESVPHSTESPKTIN